MREQALEQLDVGALRHQSAPVTNGPSAAGSPRSTGPRRGATPCRRADVGGGVALPRAGEVGDRVEVGAHLALLEVVGEAKRVLRAPKARERAGVLLGASAAAGSSPSPGHHDLEPRGHPPLVVADRARPARAPRRAGPPRTRRRRPPWRAGARAASRAARRPSPGCAPPAGGGSPPPHEASTSAAAAPPSASRRVREGAIGAQTSLRPVRISRAHWDELVAHAREDAPNECCGYLWREGRRRRGA